MKTLLSHQGKQITLENHFLVWIQRSLVNKTRMFMWHKQEMHLVSLNWNFAKFNS